MARASSGETACARACRGNARVPSVRVIATEPRSALLRVSERPVERECVAIARLPTSGRSERTYYAKATVFADAIPRRGPAAPEFHFSETIAARRRPRFKHRRHVKSIVAAFSATWQRSIARQFDGIVRLLSGFAERGRTMHTYKWLKCLVSTIVLIGMLLNFSNAGLAERRVALVIGNSAYDNAPRLNNPENDAEALSRSLATLNFTVIKKVNIDQDEFADALQEFDNALTNADIGLLFFAGHGFQMDGNNYLLSTNATLENIHSVDSEGMRLSNILTLIERKAPISISFIDACRDNPLANQLILNNAQASRSFSITRGLAALQPRFANSLVAFATAPGEVAWDGDGETPPSRLHCWTTSTRITSRFQRC